MEKCSQQTKLMGRPYNTIRRYINTDYRRVLRREEPQEKVKTRIHSTNNKRPRMRLVYTNEKIAVKREQWKMAANQLTD